VRRELKWYQTTAVLLVAALSIAFAYALRFPDSRAGELMLWKQLRVRRLAACLESESADVRWSAARALRDMGEAARPAEEALYGLLEDPDHSVRGAAEEAIGSILGIEVPGQLRAAGPFARDLVAARLAEGESLESNLAKLSAKGAGGVLAVLIQEGEQTALPGSSPRGPDWPRLRRRRSPPGLRAGPSTCAPMQPW